MDLVSEQSEVPDVSTMSAEQISAIDPSKFSTSQQVKLQKQLTDVALRGVPDVER